MSKEGVSLLKKYFPEISPTQENQFERLDTLYGEWNQKINVISRKDIDELYVRHVLHSLAIAKFISFQKGSRILDLGTGGGFPGIPLSILFPECEFVLVDSIGKKILVVNEVIQALGIKNAIGIHERVERIPGTFDFVVNRAVADLSMLVNWTKGKISNRSKNQISNGIISLKGGELEEELAPFIKKTTLISLTSYFEESFFETKKLVYLPI